MRRIPSMAVAVLAGALAVAGCGGDSDGNGGACDDVCDCTCGGAGGSCVSECIDQCEAEVETYDDCLRLQGVLAFMCQDECEAAFPEQSSY